MNKLPFLALPAMLMATPIVAQIADPAATTVQTLNTGLIATMRAGSAAGRSRTIAPVVDRTFDIPLMTRLSVGPSWTTMTAQDQSGLVNAFRALTVAQYAKNFDGYSGESFTLAPQVETRGGDKLVRTTLVVPKGNSEMLNYRLRQSGGQWKIIDVYYRNAISQLATRRADFAGVLQKGGASALIAHLNQLANKSQ